MKIRSKFLTLIIGIMISVIASISILVINNLHIRDIDKERLLMNDLLFAYHELSIYNEQLYTKDIKRTINRFSESVERADHLIDKINTLKYLNQLNPLISESLESIYILKENQQSLLKQVLDGADLLIRDFQDIGGANISFIMSDLPINPFIVDRPGYEKIIDHLSEERSTIESLGIHLEGSINVIITQNQLILEEIEKTSQRSLTSSVLISSILIVFSLIAAVFITSSIGKSIFQIRQEVSKLTSGNLTLDFNTEGNDEITDLKKDLSRFLVKLNQSITEIKKISVINSSIKESLLESTEESSAATGQIKSNIDSINNQLQLLDDSIKQSLSSIETIDNIITEESSQISKQITMVEQASTSITQMISSINCVVKTTEINQEATGLLVSIAQSGGQQINSTSVVINEVKEYISDINNMADFIQSISQQTNLLAMNAAIEAAHAGDAGKGFAVVADEIRKLAEASSRSSKDIRSTIKSIILKITEAGDSSDSTIVAFKSINEQIQNVEETHSGIHQSMKELKVGSSSILEAMFHLKKFSKDVQEGSENMNGASAVVSSTITQVQRVSIETMSGMNEMVMGINEILESMNHLTDISMEIHGISEELNNSVSFFRTKSITDNDHDTSRV
ncbi:MAG: methyl-accepting chemotaxis protein [Spirochaetaceae bacterium]